MAKKEPFLPLRNTLSILPIDQMGLPLEGTFWDFVGVDNLTFEVNKSDGTITFQTKILFISEIVVPFPGIEDLAFIIGPNEEDRSSFDASLCLGLLFSVSVEDLKSLIRIPPSIFIKAIEVEGGSWQKDEEAPYEIDLPAISVSLDQDFNIDFESSPEISLGPAFIGDTGVVIAVEGIRFHFNSNLPLPPGRQVGWRGVYVDSARLYLPADFELNNVIFGLDEAGIGSGGFFGTLSATFNNTLSETEPYVDDDEEAAGTFLGIPFVLKDIQLSFEQNIPQSAALSSELLIPYFDKILSVQIGLGIDGNFTIEVSGGSGEDGQLFDFTIEDILQLTIESLTVEKLGNVGVFALQGKLRPLLANLDWPEFEVDKLSINTHGEIDFDGGWVNIPESFNLDFHGFNISITEFGFGYEEEGTDQRQWLGLSGELALTESLPVSGSVEGLKFSWKTTEADPDLKISIEGIGVALEIPDVLAFEGSVAYEEVKPGDGNSLSGHIFKGNISLNLMVLRTEVEGELMIGKLRNAEGREFTVFYIYLGFELPAPIPLGATGLGIYGFNGLFGLHVGPTKDEETWHEWYKSPPEEYSVTTVKKWQPLYDNYGFGAGIILGTQFDDGCTINLSALLIVLIPGPVIMLEGKANLLQQRSADSEQEGAFYLLSVIDGRAGTFQLNIDVRFTKEDIITVNGGLEAFFDFHDPKNWYIYIGRKEPEEKRIRAEVLSLLKANAYFMIDPIGLQTGAAIGLDIQRRFGPISVTIIAKVAFEAAIFWKPTQLEGMLWLYGELGFRIFGIGFEIYLEMLLEGKSPDPYWVHGIARIGIKLFWPLPDLEVKAELTWQGAQDPIPVLPFLKSASLIHHKSNAVSWALQAYETADDIPEDEYVLTPVDVRPILSFARPVHNLRKEDGAALLPILPDQVAGHEFCYQLDELELSIKNDTTDNWDLVRQGVNTGADDTFLIGKDSFINGSDAQEPILQLWEYSPLDLLNRYGREEWTQRYPRCETVRESIIHTVNWVGMEDGIRYDYEFRHQGLLFLVNINEGMGSLSLPIVLREQLKTTDVFVQLSEKAVWLEVQVGDFQGHPVTIETYYQGESVKEKSSSSSDAIIVFDDNEEIDGFKITHPLGRLFLIQIRYKTLRDTIIEDGTSNGVTPTSDEGETHEKLVLKPDSKYQLKVQTSVNSEHSSTSYFYFRTDCGPGTAPKEFQFLGEPTENPYFKDKVNQFGTYVKETYPINGAKQFYYSYDLAIEFNEPYMENIYKNADSISLRVRDRNGNILSNKQGVFRRGSLPLTTSGVIVDQQSREEGGCPPYEGPETLVLYLISNSDFQPNRLFKAEVMTELDDVETILYEFQFTTSRYPSFSVHIIPDESNGVPLHSLPSDDDFPDSWVERHLGNLTAVNRARRRVLRSSGVLDTREAMLNLQESLKQSHNFCVEQFNLLEEFLSPRFAAINMEQRGLPPIFEMIRIPISGSADYALLLESPEPIEWSAIKGNFSTGDHKRTIKFLWNDDKTRAFVCHLRGALWNFNTFRVSLSLDTEKCPDLGMITKDGNPVKERVRFDIDIDS